MGPLIDRIIQFVTSDGAMLAVLTFCAILFVFALFGAIEHFFLRLSARCTWLRIPKWFLPEELR